MDFSFLLRGIFTALVGVVCYYLIEVYRELKGVKKRLGEIEKHLERTNAVETELVGLAFSDGTRFDIHLKDFGASKIHIVKEVRDITGLGLRETKELVESAPVIIQKRVSYTAAGNAKKRLEALGAVVEIVPTQLV
ncbi:MAG: ribosomal protein L7/L12 [Candidatus Poribacteria bacterium]|nr:ribosomal protein L7/L12 [Candidatus Poribacteria bacterium]